MSETQIKYIPFNSGLNLVDANMTMPEGMLTEVMNFEQVFGQQGYARISGYERYDGRPEPHLASYSVQPFDAGSAAIVAGDVVTGTSASAKVLSVELTSGSWAGGNAAGRLILYDVTGSWVDNEAIKVLATTYAIADGATGPGSTSEASHATYMSQVIAARRSAIAAVPGSGPVLGIGVAANVVYAARNVTDGTSATLYKATAGGWSAVKTGFYPGGRFRMIQDNFTGSTETLFLFGCDGKNRPFRFDGTTFTFIDPIYGSQATSTSSLSIGTGSKTFTVAQTSRSWKADEALIVWAIGDAGKFMAGTVTSYTSGTNTLVMDVTMIGGTGTVASWEIGKANFSDKPFELIGHRDHLFLAFPYGQLQSSNLGDPMTYSTTSSLFGLGDEITGLRSIKGGVLAIYTESTVQLLEGADKTSWSKTNNSYSSGAIFGTVQELAQSVLALDVRGLTSLQATLNFGSFEMSVFSRYVKPYLDALIDSVIGSHTVRSKNQYRLYSSSGVVMTTTLLTPNPQITPKDVSITRSDYGVTIHTVGEGTIDGEDYLFFGTDDGFVMREDVGTSFDGEVIPSVLRIPFVSLKSPSRKKRFRKLILEIDAPQETTIYFRQLFDYADGTYNGSINYSTVARGGGGQWNLDEWDTFRWSLPVQTQAEANIDGVGRNMSLLIWHESAGDAPFFMQGIVLHYSPLGLSR